MDTIYNLRGANKLLFAWRIRSTNVESEFESIVYDARERLIKEIEAHNSNPHNVARDFNLKVYLSVFDGLCRGYTYDEIGRRLGMNRNNVGFTVERLRKFQAVRELYIALRDKVQNE